jgi:hypothetical protein
MRNEIPEKVAEQRSGRVRVNSRFFAASRAPLRGEDQEARDSAQNDKVTLCPAESSEICGAKTSEVLGESSEVSVKR